MYRIRFHGRGGQGMKTASRILGEAFFLEGFEVQDAQRYGAERRGAPIFAYVRAAKEAIHERGVIARPGLIVVADDTLVAIAAAGVMQGLNEDCVVLIDSAESAAAWAERLNLPGPVIILPAHDTREAGEAAFVGVECAAAAACLAGVISQAYLEEAIRRELAPMGDEVVAQNLGIAADAYAKMEPYAGIVRADGTLSARAYKPPDWVDLPLEGVSLAGPAIYGGVNSELTNTGLWRTMRPVIDLERCNKCSWVCVSSCPDSAIQARADGTPEIDLDHCKGCMLCVAQCPPHAIGAVPETEALAREKAGEPVCAAN
jgi:pyruvate ferredoxin oxidoreductase gamma subunit